MKKRLLYWLIMSPLLAATLLPATTVRAQATEILKPAAYTFSATGTNTSPEYAYDGATGGEDTTYNRLGVSDNNDNPTMEYHTWQSASQTHTARRLYIRRSGAGNTDDTWGIYYSTNGGSSYTPIEEGLINPAKGNTTAVTIDTGLDLSNLWIKISTYKSKGPDGGSADIWDIWLEGDYNTPPEVGTQIGAEYPITISPSAMTPQEEWTTITVPVKDASTLADVNEVKVKLFYDSAGTDPGEAGFSADVQTCAILTWTRGGVPDWTIAPSSTTWALNTAGCSKPADSATQGNWVFSFKVGKVATHSPGTDDWDIYAKATDAASDTGEDYLRDTEMNWYGEITENTVTVDWGMVVLGSGFTDDTTNRVNASVTYICNGNYNKQIKTSSPWGTSPTVTLNPSGTPSAGEFSLKADDDLTLADAVLVSTGYTTFGTGIQTDESGVTEASNGVWLKTGPSGITGGVAYDGTIYYAITQQ